MGQKTGLWQPRRDEELKQLKWNYWDLWQATPSTTTKQQLHTQRITDYKHTGQDRRIQKEMASTHTKNATKANSSKIIQLQTARKKINWRDLKNVGESNYNPGDGTNQRVQSLVFMMMTVTPLLGELIDVWENHNKSSHITTGSN